MVLSKFLNVLGLVASLVGAGMLFFCSIWKQQTGNTIMTPDLVWQFQEDVGHSAVPQPTWGPIADKLWRWGRYLNGWGFALIKLTAEVEAAKRDAAQTVTDANRAINECYDKADRVIDTAQAIVAGSASSADVAAMMSIINSTRPTPPASPAVTPSVQCTSRTVGNRVETDCN